MRKNHADTDQKLPLMFPSKISNEGKTVIPETEKLKTKLASDRGGLKLLSINTLKLLTCICMIQMLIVVSECMSQCFFVGVFLSVL